MRRDPYPIHGRRRRWFAPFTVICRCGLDAYPCAVVRAFRAQGAEPPVPAESRWDASSWEAWRSWRW